MARQKQVIDLSDRQVLFDNPVYSAWVRFRQTNDLMVRARDMVCGWR